MIKRGTGPDDGAGYQLLIGTTDCRFDARPALFVEIEDRREFREGRPIVLPHRSREPGKGDWLNAMRRCAGDSKKCAAPTGGSLSMDRLVPGEGARGSYRFETADGVLSGSFNAVWCGSRD